MRLCGMNIQCFKEICKGIGVAAPENGIVTKELYSEYQKYKHDLLMRMEVGFWPSENQSKFNDIVGRMSIKRIWIINKYDSIDIWEDIELDELLDQERYMLIRKDNMKKSC